MNLQIKDIINEIRPVVINKKRTELDARHDIGRENKVTEIMELISTKNIDLMEYLESMLTIVEQKFKFRIELHPCAFESGGDELCTVPNALNKFIRFGQ